MICARCDNSKPETIAKIQELLDERFYVPVIRSVDNSMPPIIGEPFSPNNPPVRLLVLFYLITLHANLPFIYEFRI